MLPERNSDIIMPALYTARSGEHSCSCPRLPLLLAESPAFSQTVRYELFLEPDVRQTATNRTASAYVVDKKVNQFWICTIWFIEPAIGAVQFCTVRHAGACGGLTLP
jgi:hypothetical protein